MSPDIRGALASFGGGGGHRAHLENDMMIYKATGLGEGVVGGTIVFLPHPFPISRFALFPLCL